MTLTRSLRNDRRRRVLLESASQDTELVVETARARRKARDRRKENDYDDYDNGLYRDPGYSQAVRRTCQQRVVQWIPVRRGALAALLTALWGGFIALLVAHFFIFTNTNADSANYLARTPIGLLFHLRSPHGIAHWLSCQLWLLTGLVCWLVFNLRRHKLDDYRARYRVWIVVALASLFSSFDASTSVLQLIGMSIDNWTRREIGYAGWPLVLASFASLIGVLGIRISAELKSVPSSVASWILGLVAWAAAALLGTGILKITLAQQYVDLLVGALWLGGVLAVFQAVSLYLRTTYIQAQKRFLQRSGCELGPIQIGMPKVKVPFGRRAESDDFDEELDAESDEESTTSRKRWGMPWKRRKSQTDDLDSDEDQTEASKPAARQDKRKRDRSLDDDIDEVTSTKSSKEDLQDEEENRPKAKRLFGLIPNRQARNEELEEEPIAEDNGGEIDRGLTKKPGWFGIGGNKKAATQEQSEDAANDAEEPKKRKLWSRKVRDTKSDPATEDVGSDTELTTAPKKSIREKLPIPKWPSRSKKLNTTESEDSEEVVAPKPKKGWGVPLPKLKKSPADAAQKDSSDAKSTDNASGSPSTPKKKLFGLRKNKDAVNSEAAEATKASKKSDKGGDSEAKPKKKWFGFLDEIKLKPPVAGEESSEGAPNVSSKPNEKIQAKQPAQENKSSSSATTSSRPSVPPQSPPVFAPVPVKQSAPLPSTSGYDDDEDDDDDDYGSKPLSKAERKRLKRENRRAG